MAPQNEPPAVATLRTELVAAVQGNTARMCAGLRAELARPVMLEAGRRLQFEVDPFSWGISSCASEEPVTEGYWLSESLADSWFERCEEAGVNWDELIEGAVCPWFADCWQAVGGPARFSPAYLFLHGYHDQQYDLERRCWVPSAVAFEE